MPKETKEETYTRRHHASNDLKHEVFAKAHEEYKELKKTEAEKKEQESAHKLHNTL